MSELNPDAQSCRSRLNSARGQEETTRELCCLPCHSVLALIQESTARATITQDKTRFGAMTKEDSHGREQVISSLGLSFPHIYASSFIYMPISYIQTLTHIHNSSCWFST